MKNVLLIYTKYYIYIYDVFHKNYLYFDIFSHTLLYTCLLFQYFLLFPSFLLHCRLSEYKSLLIHANWHGIVVAQ